MVPLVGWNHNPGLVELINVVVDAPYGNTPSVHFLHINIGLQARFLI